MNRTPAAPVLALAATVLPLLAACGGDSPADLAVEPTALLSVVPEGGATGVDPTRPVMMAFDHPLMDGMEAFVDLHEGDVTGPDVPGHATFSEGHTVLTFTPDAPLKPLTGYTLHLGGGMMGVDGGYVDFDEHGFGMGGMWADDGMMEGGHMGGGMMGGDQDYHMGDGWRNPESGYYGMVFPFTTGS